jgi:hypothetical protein
MAEAVSRRPLSAEARVRAQVSPCGICGGSTGIFFSEFLDFHPSTSVRRSSSVSSVWLRAGRPGERGSISGRGERIFNVASVSRPTLGPSQPPVQWVPGVLFPGAKARLGRDADQSPPSSAECPCWLRSTTPCRHMWQWVLLILNLGTRWRWVVSVTSRSHFSPEEIYFSSLFLFSINVELHNAIQFWALSTSVLVSVKKRPSWSANNHSATQKIRLLLWN